jgi:hypothetical protein
MAEESSTTGWVPGREGLAGRRAIASRLVGKRITEVHYVTLDYGGWDLGHHDQSVRRAITDTSEWQNPSWDWGQFHHIDWGIEFSVEDGELWSLTWDPPGETQSLLLDEGPTSELGAAEWDVTDQELWRSCLDSVVTDVQLRYHPWNVDEGSFWCSRISIFFGARHVEALLATRGPTDTILIPSANNITVLLDPSDLPAWERTDDLV